MRRGAAPAAAALFVLTGASALIAEQAFEKLLEPLLGTTVHAAAAVLSIYFAGLTIGGWAYRFLRRTPLPPLRLYALLELGVGLWALLLYAALDHVAAAFLPLLRTFADHFAALEAARLAVASLWILPPTMLMGATFPAMVDFITANTEGGRRAVTRFYALNLLGAAIAAGAAPYFLFAPFGLDNGILAAGCLDLLVALAAGMLLPRDARAAEGEEGARDRPAAMLIVAAAGSGLLFFALEVIWTHLIAVVCGNSVYAFAAMLFAVLAGLFAGSAVAARVAPAESAVPAAAVGFAFIAGAALLVGQQAAWPYAPHLFTLLGGGIRSFAAGEALRTAVAMALVAPVAAVLGSVFPVLFRLREFPLREQGRAAGVMTAANAIGCCCGALLAAFVLIPAAGSERALVAIAAAYAVIGIAVAGKRGGLALGAVVLVACALLPRWDRLRLTSGENVYFKPFVDPRSRLLFFHEDSAGGFTTVVESPEGVRTLLTNGKFQGNDSGEREAQTAFAIVPALHASRFDDAMVIGAGTGQSARVVCDLGFRRVDVAEIAPGMLAAASGYFGRVNGGVLARPNVRAIVEDGRNVLQLHDRRYDLITIEITSFWFAGATNLYSRDFYRAVAARLQPGGVLQQWMQLHHTSPRELASQLASMRAVFPSVSFWAAGGQGVAIATMEPQALRAEGLARAVRIVGAGRVRRILRARLLSEDDVARFTADAGAPVNDDRNRWLEYQSPRYNFGGDRMDENVRALRSTARAAPLRAEPGARPLIAAILRAPLL